MISKLWFLYMMEYLVIKMFMKKSHHMEKCSQNYVKWKK